MTPQINYNWAVWADNKIVGYVKSESEMDALRLAKDNVVKDRPFFIERTYLGNPIPVEENFYISGIVK
jgi:hypothetical protein